MTLYNVLSGIHVYKVFVTGSLFTNTKLPFKDDQLFSNAVENEQEYSPSSEHNEESVDKCYFHPRIALPTATRAVFCSAAASGNYNACTYMYLKKKHIHMGRCRIPLQNTKSVLNMLIRTKRHVYINHLFQYSVQSTVAAAVHVSTRRDIKIPSSTEFAYRKSSSVKSKYVVC